MSREEEKGGKRNKSHEHIKVVFRSSKNKEERFVRIDGVVSSRKTESGVGKIIIGLDRQALFDVFVLLLTK